MPSDIEIAKSVPLKPISQIAKTIGIGEDDLEPYGRYKAKVNLRACAGRKSGKLILVTAINPTPAGEGKTTVSIGLADGMRLEGSNSVLALREPSLGPVFGVKGGAAGGGWSQVLPMEEINLHFTGDLHAITTANNLLAAMIDNHIFQGNALGIDPRRVSWRRCMDMNDRQLRHIVSGLGEKSDGMPRQDGFDITAASEIMAILCLASDYADLRRRLGAICVGYAYSGEPVFASQLHAEGAMLALLKDALLPNLVQTIGGTPAFIHGGPFANIAHGCNSIVATRMAMACGDVCVTEAGFGADLGAEKFLDIKCRVAGIQPDAVVLVVTLRALKMHGGVTNRDESKDPNAAALKKGAANLKKHLSTLTQVYNMPVVVALNRFTSDTEEEIALLQELVDAPVVVCDAWGRGGEGCRELAKAVLTAAEAPKELHFAYDLKDPLEKKIEDLAKNVYGAADVEFAAGTKTALRAFDALGNFPVCIAKTQYSLSDAPKKLGAPKNHTLHIREVTLRSGAGFVVAFAGAMLAMPGLPPVPAAETVSMDDEGNIDGLF